jgi:hypothetical protein
VNATLTWGVAEEGGERLPDAAGLLQLLLRSPEL